MHFEFHKKQDLQIYCSKYTFIHIVLIFLTLRYQVTPFKMELHKCKLNFQSLLQYTRLIEKIFSLKYSFLVELLPGLIPFQLIIYMNGQSAEFMQGLQTILITRNLITNQQSHRISVTSIRYHLVQWGWIVQHNSPLHSVEPQPECCQREQVCAVIGAGFKAFLVTASNPCIVAAVSKVTSKKSIYSFNTFLFECDINAVITCLSTSQNSLNPYKR